MSDISQKLKDSFSSGTEESKIKRLQGFLSNTLINRENVYEFFTYKLFQNYKNRSNKIYIIFDYTNIDDRFVILQFSLKIGKRAVPLWYIANNLDQPTAIREYKKRFDIEEMFKDFKGGGFNVEKTWSEDIHYIRMLYLSISIAYCWMITIGTFCSKDKKNKIIGATETLKGKKVRIYSLFRPGLKWFNRCYYSLKSDYYFSIHE